MQIILASQSPRRRELMERVCPEFITCPADIDESALPPAEGAAYAKALALEKAQAVAKKFPGDIVVGCDTVVCAQGKILGKPADEAQAARYLRLLSGSVHQVVTGVALVSAAEGGESSCPGGPLWKQRVFHQSTLVRFYPLDEEEIAAYIASGEPMDKAGAYGIQGLGSLLVEGIEGDYFNVVGLPVAKLSRELKNFRKELEKNS